MPDVRITVNKQTYVIGCGEGEEDRLREVAAYFDAQVTALADAHGQIGDSRLLIMAGLQMTEQLASMGGGILPPPEGEAFARTLLSLAARINGVADDLSHAATAPASANSATEDGAPQSGRDKSDGAH